MAIAPLPQLERLFLTDAGLETDILFNRGSTCRILRR